MDKNLSNKLCGHCKHDHRGDILCKLEDLDEKDRKLAKNYEKLKDFIAYCIEHKDERFWQALCNWAGVSTIYVVRFNKMPKEQAKTMALELGLASGAMGLEDTYYWE